MISSIQASPMQGAFSSTPPTPPTAEQTALIQEKLASIDPDNITDEDKDAINSMFEEMGLKPSKEIAGLMSDVGIDPSQLRPEGSRPPPPPPQAESSAEDNELTSLIQSFVEQFESGDLDEAELSSFVQSLQDSGFGSSGNLLDIEA
ncbi:hypothetical protein DBZ36_18210 [Alginatibacterium sediminis]|uniref:Uncharacterized protein n=1 Tax=Alginatibacterium sediminis TaxID=2164068 RepID=A0A420E6C9_9ALTE|nr:hypothetical protein [Alginatibacterium sediminis]RKF13706.1 hypothetical protein DBZ36_18210 [Alginatibacterium sediminis]